MDFNLTLNTGVRLLIFFWFKDFNRICTIGLDIPLPVRSINGPKLESGLGNRRFEVFRGKPFLGIKLMDQLLRFLLCDLEWRLDIRETDNLLCFQRAVHRTTTGRTNSWSLVHEEILCPTSTSQSLNRRCFTLFNEDALQSRISLIQRIDIDNGL